MNAHQFEAVKRAAYAVGPSTAILSAGLAMHARPEMPLVALSEIALAVGAGSLGVKHGWPIAWVFAGGFGYDALVTVHGAVHQAALPPGSTPIGGEEATLRQAIRACYGHELLACSTEVSERGWRAVVSLPPQLPRERLRREWERVRGALAATGRYDLEDGEYDNQLVIRYSSGSGFPAAV